MTTTKPPKEQVRSAMLQHRTDRKLPTPEEYRRQLGWGLIPENESKEAEPCTL